MTQLGSCLKLNLMKATQIRSILKALGYQVKLSRRNGIREAVEVLVIKSGNFGYFGGNSDLEAFQGALSWALQTY